MLSTTICRSMRVGSSNSSMKFRPGSGAASIPRVTEAQRDALPGPAEGTVIYNLTTHRLECWDGTAWRVVAFESE